MTQNPAPSQRIAIYGATGMIGSRIAAEAVRRGHTVTALTRSGAAVEGATARVGNLSDATDVQAVAADHDVIVSATGPSRTGAPHAEWLAALDTLIANGADARVLAVGGAGSLLLPDGSRLVDSPEFPEIYKTEALTQADALDKFRAAPEGLDWSYLSPAPMIAPGERTEGYRTGGDEVIGENVSAEDYAAALVDEIEAPAHSRQRFTVVS